MYSNILKIKFILDFYWEAYSYNRKIPAVRINQCFNSITFSIKNLRCTLIHLINYGSTYKLYVFGICMYYCTWYTLVNAHIFDHELMTKSFFFLNPVKLLSGHRHINITRIMILNFVRFYTCIIHGILRP